jgi:RNA polymerase sigma-70 factor (ECF subfamily)
LLIRACIDVLRRRRSRPIEVEFSPTGPAMAFDVASRVADREIVEDALRHLDPSSRAIVVMHYFLGMPLPEASGILGIPLGTAKSRLHRSLALMRSVIASEAGTEIGSRARGHVT